MHKTSLALVLFVTACGSDSKPPTEDAPESPPGPVLSRPSKSSTIALSDDGSHVAMVNPEDGSLSIFQTSDNTRIAKVATGGSPAGVVIGPDSKTAYVSNRADGTVVRVSGIDGGTPAVDATAQVGSEPIGLALSPTGKQLFVAEYAESRVSVIDTATMQITKSLPIDRPRALMVTNNADQSDADETLVVAQYFGTPAPGGEAKDDGRTGHIALISLADFTQKDISLAPIDSGFPKGGVSTNPTVHASPNQLGAVAVANGRLYVTSVAASPEGPPRFDNNVFPVVYVADLASAAEVRDATGTVNLARKVYDAIPSPSAAAPRFVPGELSDLDFVPTSNVAYVVGRAGDVMVRVTFGASSVDIGSTQNKEIDLAGNTTIGQCQAPTGVVVDAAHQRAYVNCWVTRKLGVVDLAAQSLTAAIESSAPPTDATGLSQQRGRRFYFTGRGRWSANPANGAKGGEGWSSCGSCHPDGLTDNMTWIFGSGPRQTTSQDGTFSHGPGIQKQRMLNWTAINDEHHDFENNTRGVSGGLGAITTAATPSDCGQLDKETQVSLTGIAGVGRPLKEIADDPNTATCGHKDWDDVEAYVKTIQPVHAKKALDAAAVARGRQLFVDGNCAKCHGGAGWTVSRRFYTPTSATMTSLANTTMAKPSFFPSTWMYDNGGAARQLVSPQPAIANADATGPAEPNAVAVAQSFCSLRNVGTFGVPGDTSATDALELRPANGALTRAEGRGGYNVPSLYGLALGAPYLHHGQSPSLQDLFSNTAWGFHTNAGNANFSVTLAGAGKVDDLVAFLLSIDASTPEIDVPTDAQSGSSFDACPASF
ncbi:MAG: beta-propeller fold lactonase family protein [Deltaproteobacteria bacterium]|nr:beta-propeller fold lactonase family protein [Deltaproteobacteria bacterium]